MTAIALSGATGCAPAHPTTPFTLGSGKVVPLLDARPSEAGFYIEYCTDNSLRDREVVRPELSEVLDSFRSQLVDRTEVSIGPTNCNLEIRWAGWRPVFVRYHSTWFRFERDATGQWMARN